MAAASGHGAATGLSYLIGRRKFFVNEAGLRIDPREGDESLETHPEVREAMIVTVIEFGDSLSHEIRLRMLCRRLRRKTVKCSSHPLPRISTGCPSS